MIARTLTITAWLLLAASAMGQDHSARPVADLLPHDARIIETANVPLRDTSKQRRLVLWMSEPRRVMSTWDSASDFLYGDHWLGPTFLSLVEPSTSKLINTVRVRTNSEDEEENFVLPFFTNDGFYDVPHPDTDRRGKPLLMHLRDFTGEGVAAQFVLFDHVVSGIAAGSVLGYSSHADMAVQYSVETTQNKFSPVVQLWAVQVFDSKPLRAGYWKFTWEPAHGSSELIDEEVHFDRARQLFIEKSASRPYPGFAEIHCYLETAALSEFLGHMRSVAPDGIDIKWLQGLITKTRRNAVGSAGMVPTFNGAQESLDVQFQTNTRGAIAVELSTDSAFGAVLLAQLKTWCTAN